jgi:6-methylsalicylate decarboxylase
MNAELLRRSTTLQKPAWRKHFGSCACCALVAEPPNRRRRNFLVGGIAALGLGASGTKFAVAQPAAPSRPRVDVHHHYLPLVQAKAFADSHVGNMPRWSPQMSLDDMDKAGVQTSVLSLVQPGVWFGDGAVEASRKLARECNDYGAQLRKDYPGRFGLFAAIPLPDTEGSLREIEYALDVLKADGIGLYTSYAGKYLGDATFVPVFEELNRRKAVVYTHPVSPACCSNMIGGVQDGTIEYATDTTRTIASLIFADGGTVFRCPDIRFVWSHSGGTLPFLIGRFIRQTTIKKDLRMPDGPVPVVKRFYYEIAQGNLPGQFAALLKLIPVSQLMFGSDYPYREGVEAVDGMNDYPFSDADRVSINRETALRLMPQLAG